MPRLRGAQRRLRRRLRPRRPPPLRCRGRPCPDRGLRRRRPDPRRLLRPLVRRRRALHRLLARNALPDPRC
ncbi:MAG: hypothetical protein E6J13_12600 [Chloroflexi bacterium]|nr:MAG: hypothetical protein E6J13_12600 [Chloroflexota bacterium]